MRHRRLRDLERGILERRLGRAHRPAQRHLRGPFRGRPGGDIVDRIQHQGKAGRLVRGHRNRAQTLQGLRIDCLEMLVEIAREFLGIAHFPVEIPAGFAIEPLQISHGIGLHLRHNAARDLVHQQ